MLPMYGVIVVVPPPNDPGSVGYDNVTDVVVDA